MTTTPKSDRGLRRIEFLDLYDAPCIVADSSLATEPAVWLGPEDGGRMLLGQALARWLAARLLEFAEAGRLPDEHEASPGHDDPEGSSP